MWEGSLNRGTTVPIERGGYLHTCIYRALFNTHCCVAADLAAWRDNRNIGEHEVCRSVLEEAGFDAESLLQKASSEPVKKLLFANTSRY